MQGRRTPAVLLVSLVLAGLAAGGSPAGAAPLSAVAQLGRRMFFDITLSGSGRMSCASCHDPANHYSPDNALAVQRGGPAGRSPGLRAAPSLTYRWLTPGFSVGPPNLTNDPGEAAPMALAAGVPAPAARPALATRPPRRPKSGNTAANIVPRGGMFWDGRAATLEAQALGPLLSPFEMANPAPAALAAKIRQRYGRALAALFGASVLSDPRMTDDEAAFAIARYQIEDPSFHPFTSKYDAWLAGRATLTPAEARGLKLFNDPAKGNCAACHLDKPGPDGQPPLFTDFEYEALGLPRNPAIPANADPAYFDLGLCGPLRHDGYARQPRNCGLFKTPSLRNVATRHAFFHNGVYHSLTAAVRFYADRDTRPGLIYPRGPDGRPEKFDDLPQRYRGNVDRIDPPLNRKRGDAPALTGPEIADIVAFLHTLTDGYAAAARPARKGLDGRRAGP